MEIGYPTKCDTCQKECSKQCPEYRDYTISAEELNELIEEVKK